jgi:hypothetical protein
MLKFHMNPNHDENGLFADSDSGNLPAGSHGGLGEQFGKSVEILGNEMGLNWSDPKIQQAVSKWARAHFQGKEFTNKQTGIPIRVSARGIKKTVTHMPDRKPLKALAKLDKLLEEATHAGRHPPRNEAPNVRAVHVFNAKTNLEGAPHNVKIIVKEDNNGHWFYDHHVTEQ